jgi:hypothetical protein
MSSAEEQRKGDFFGRKYFQKSFQKIGIITKFFSIFAVPNRENW